MFVIRNDWFGNERNAALQGKYMYTYLGTEYIVSTSCTLALAREVTPSLLRQFLTDPCMSEIVYICIYNDVIMTSPHSRILIVNIEYILSNQCDGILLSTSLLSCKRRVMDYFNSCAAPSTFYGVELENHNVFICLKREYTFV